MPSFWTADAPLEQFPVRIQPDSSGPEDSGLQVEVSPTTFEKLARAAEHHARLSTKNTSALVGSRIYVSIRTANGGCVAAVAKSYLASASGDVAVCQVGRSVWAALGGRDAWESATLEVVDPVELTELVLGVDAAQYADAITMQKEIAEHVQAKLFRHNREVRVGGLTLRCLMCQPVAQGIVRPGSDPKIVIVKDTRRAEMPVGDTVGEEWEDLGAEWFILDGAGDTLLAAAGPHGVEIKAAALLAPVDHAKIAPVENGEDTGNRGYAELATLAKLGVVSGSWVAVTSAHSDSAERRAIRVFGCDGIATTDTLALPPLLFHSLQASGIPSTESIPVTAVPLGVPPSTPSPAFLEKEPTQKFQPALEVARKVVIARIISPLAERRDLEAHALAALQAWLKPEDGALRVVRTGDVIAVRVCLADAMVRTKVAVAAGNDAAARIRSGENDMDPSVVDVDPVNDLVFDTPVIGDSGKVDANELVFYKIVSAEGFRNRWALSYDSESEEDSEYEYISDYDEEDDEEEDLDAIADPLDRQWAQWYRRVRGLGLVVQPNTTMVAQTGSVHAHAPYQAIRAFQDIQGAPSSGAEPYANVRGQLLRLARAALHPLAARRRLVCAALLKGNPGTGKRHVVRSLASTLGVHLYELSSYDILGDTADKTAQALQLYFQNAMRYTPCILHLRQIEALAQNAAPGEESDDLPIARVLKACLDDLTRAHRESGFPVLVVATSSMADKIPSALAAAFRHELELPVPDETTRTALLARMSQGLTLAPDADLAFVAQQTASFVARDLAMLFKRAANRAWRRARPQATTPLQTRSMALSQQIITNDDLVGALGDARASMSDTLGVPKIPNVKWDDVGGLADAKKDILDTIRLPLEQPHLFASGLSTRSGLLFYGPPGTGKTLLAKAIATECGLNFFSCKGPELISPYIGESEANVRKIFQRAREASPCVIFFDELDSLAPKRGQQGDSGGVMDRIVSQLLAELDGMSGGGSEDGDKAAAAPQVFAIGATNRPDLLDPALLRPGRFDKLVYLGVSETHAAQLNIIQALTRKFHLHRDLDLAMVAEQCPFHYTGADFYALCSDALLKAMLRTVDEVDVLVNDWNSGNAGPGAHYPVPMTPQYYLDHIAPDHVKQVTVTMADFERALDELIPSVSADELVRYQQLRRQFDSTLKNAQKEAEEEPAAMPPRNKGKQIAVEDGEELVSSDDLLRRLQQMLPDMTVAPAPPADAVLAAGEVDPVEQPPPSDSPVAASSDPVEQQVAVRFGRLLKRRQSFAWIRRSPVLVPPPLPPHTPEQDLLAAQRERERERARAGAEPIRSKLKRRVSQVFSKPGRILRRNSSID
ncbi:peroxisomal assembly protein [Linderina pennispora]|nr:peroxisomal assembly protein [Linderina pennispora]